MAGVCEVLCRSALQLGLGFAPHLTAPSNASGKAPTEGELVQRYSFHTAPSGLLGPLSDHRAFCLVGALLMSLSYPVLRLQWHRGLPRCMPEKVLVY